MNRYIGTKLLRVSGKTQEEKYDNFCEELIDMLYDIYSPIIDSPDLNRRATKFANRYLNLNKPIHHGKKLVHRVVVDASASRGFRLTMIV